jgi:hypothetical protein
MHAKELAAAAWALAKLKVQGEAVSGALNVIKEQAVQRKVWLRPVSICSLATAWAHLGRSDDVQLLEALAEVRTTSSYKKVMRLMTRVGLKPVSVLHYTQQEGTNGRHGRMKWRGVNQSSRGLQHCAVPNKPPAATYAGRRQSAERQHLVLLNVLDTAV